MHVIFINAFEVDMGIVIPLIAVVLFLSSAFSSFFTLGHPPAVALYSIAS